MNNGKVTAAEIDAILSGGREEIDRYLVTFALGAKKTLEDLPEALALSVSDAVAACRVESADRRERVDELWSARERAKGVRSFWSTMGKVLAALCALAGLFVTLMQFAH
jgi:hypothetical protein